MGLLYMAKFWNVQKNSGRFQKGHIDPVIAM